MKRQLLTRSVVMIGLTFAISSFAYGQQSAQDNVKDDEATRKALSQIASALTFDSSMDGTVDAGLFDEDGWAYTADDLNRKSLEQGNRIKEVVIAKDEGLIGDCLQFTDKTKQVLLYKAKETAAFFPQPDWKGSISFFLRLDPNKDLKPGYCDPIQVAGRKWNDASIWVDFDKELPRTFRLGVFSDFKSWNPNNIDFDKFPEAELPRCTVLNPPFAADKWTHVLITFKDINSTTDKAGTAKLYLDGELAGTINKKFVFTWDKDSPQGAIMLGLNYIGYLDELSVYNRDLTAAEAKLLYEHGRSD